MTTAPRNCTHRTLLVVLTSMLLLGGGTSTNVFAGEEKSAKSPLQRYLLVASEGLYVVEPDGSCSWSYNPTPYSGEGWVEYDDLVYDGCTLPDDRFLFATHRYVREIDRDGNTIWEFRVEGTAEVKACVPLPNNRVAVQNSEEQVILELERGTGKILHHIPVPAKGGNHTRYNSMRLTPEGNYLIALRAEERFVEITRDGKILNSYPVEGLPVMAERLENGDTLCTGGFGVVRFGADGKTLWSLTKEDSPFPIIYPAGIHQFDDGRLLVSNSDWHYMEKDLNRVQAFLLDAEGNIKWTLDKSAFGPWKKSETEPQTGFVEHRVCLIQPLDE